MRHRLASLVIVTTGLLLAVTTATGQAPAYRAPRTGDGKPNLNGIWQALNTANWDIQAHSSAPGLISDLGASNAVPGGMGVVEGEIPYKPEALAKKKENYANRLKLDPENKCYLPGVPRATYMPYPFQILQSQKHIMILHEFVGAVRTIYMDNATEAPADSWMGWSNGRWEGEALVVDTSGFNDKSWLTIQGHPHTEAMHVTERISRPDLGHLNIEFTIEDKETYKTPWVIQRVADLNTTDEVGEYVCAEGEKDAPHLVGK